MNSISEKQLKANRQNAKLGGVKTLAGIEISKMNALKHGILSNKTLLESEQNEIDEFIKLKTEITDQLLPMGEFEIFLTDRIITNIWRLRRLMKIESSSMEYEKNDIYPYDEEYSNRKQKELNKYAKMFNGKNTQKMMRYETMIERGIFRSLHELQRIQAIRFGGRVVAPIMIDIDITKGI